MDLTVSLETKKKGLREKVVAASSGFFIGIIYLKLPGLKEKLPAEVIDNLDRVYEYNYPTKENAKKLWLPAEIEKTFLPIQKALDELDFAEPKAKEDLTWDKKYVVQILELAKIAKKHKLKLWMSIG